jgi:hypothetical protein
MTPGNRISGHYPPPPEEPDDDGRGDDWEPFDGIGCLLTLFLWFVSMLVCTIVFLALCKVLRVAWEILWQ